MTEAVAADIWIGVGAYAAVGALVALALLLGAMRRYDPRAAVAPWRVKLLIVPGIVALWPMVLMRLLRARPA